MLADFNLIRQLASAWVSPSIQNKRHKNKSKLLNQPSGITLLSTERIENTEMQFK
jgi:hypothetical protein